MALNLNITPSMLGLLERVPGIELEPEMCKATALPTVHLSALSFYFLIMEIQDTNRNTFVLKLFSES